MSDLETPRSSEPIRVPSIEERALRKTIRALIAPAVGATLWELLMLWIEARFLAGTTQAGVAIVLGTIFGLPALSGIYWGVRELYLRILDDLEADDRQRVEEARWQHYRSGR